MLISNLINDSFGLLSKQLRFYCWHYKRDLDQRQQQELVQILNEQYFERLANKIKSLNASNIADCKQQIGKLLFEQCLASHRRHQLIQLIESDLVDIDVRLDNYGRTLLHRTAYNLDVELVKLLIEHGVNIYLRDFTGSTALHIAIQSYRNGGLIYNNEPEVIQNITQIITLLLDTDRNLQKSDQCRNKKLKMDAGIEINHDMNLLRLSKLNEDSSDSKETEFNSHRNIEQKKLVPVIDHRTRGNQTICRFMGSQCVCKNDNHSHQNQASTKPTGDTPRSSVQESQTETTDKSRRHSAIQPACGLGSSRLALIDELGSIPLVNTKNAFGRTPLHYCVLVVGEPYLDQIIKLLLSYGADPDIVDTRMKTPLYHLVKKPATSAIRKRCLAISHLIESGCDDLGLSISPRSYFTERMLGNLEVNIENIMRKQNSDEKVERIFTQTTFRRVPRLKHLSRLSLVKTNDERNGKLGRQAQIVLPNGIPNLLNLYVNRKLLDQTELF